MKRNIMLLKILTVFVVLVVGTSFALAQAERFEKRSGAYWPGAPTYSITCGEEFASMDTDGTGLLSRGEYWASYKPASPATVPSTTGAPAQFAFESRDLNNDGYISAQEFCTS